MREISELYLGLKSYSSSIRGRITCVGIVNKSAQNAPKIHHFKSKVKTFLGRGHPSSCPEPSCGRSRAGPSSTNLAPPPPPRVRRAGKKDNRLPTGVVPMGPRGPGPTYFQKIKNMF